MQFTPTGNIILVHKGALGDFLLGWPSMLSIRSAFPEAGIYWAGRADYLYWLNPLRINRLPRLLENTLALLYHTRNWPDALEKYSVFWFGINRITTLCRDRRLLFLTGVDRTGSAGFRKTCLSRLEKNGIQPSNDWQKIWNDYFGPKKKPEHALIFPGSGNNKKNWPLKAYLELAHLLKMQGFSIKFVLGPIEQEQGLNIPGFDKVVCHNLLYLQELIKKSWFVIGNDCGPMQLAGMFNVPGVALFGPTSPDIWAPHGIETITSFWSCRPCSETGVIDCPDPVCMSDIDIDQVMKILKERIINKLD